MIRPRMTYVLLASVCFVLSSSGCTDTPLTDDAAQGAVKTIVDGWWSITVYDLESEGVSVEKSISLLVGVENGEVVWVKDFGVDVPLLGGLANWDETGFVICATVEEAGMIFNVCWEGQFPPEGVSINESYDPILCVLTITNTATNQTNIYDTVLLHRIVG
jgi:hypothetical protein